MMKAPLLTWPCAVAVLFSSLMGDPGAQALPNAAPDDADRFPFVVAVKAYGRLICSGTVLYPRIVVTAAHCLQNVVAWRGMRFYVNDYLKPEAVSVSVVQGGATRSYAVEEIAISPDWLRAGASQRRDTRLPHDLALLVIKTPIELDGQVAGLDSAPLTPNSPAGPARLRGVLVAFGGTHCVSAGGCDDAGVRRFLRVAMKDGGTCFTRRRDRAAGLRFSVWCVDSGVMPGDSGGALLVEAPDGALHYAGVISAQSGLPPAASAAWRHSAAVSLEPNFEFIVEKARALGYAPVTADP